MKGRNRNEPCTCGCGLKRKACDLRRHEREAAEERVREAAACERRAAEHAERLKRLEYRPKPDAVGEQIAHVSGRRCGLRHVTLLALAAGL